MRLAGAVLLLVFVVTVAVRATMMRKRGIKAFVFGKTDRSDFLLLIVILAMWYNVLGCTFGWPIPFGGPLHGIAGLQCAGILLCLAGEGMLIMCLKSFGDSFRVGIDEEKPDKLVMDGMFAYTRNPVYCSFFIFFTGLFLIFTSFLMVCVIVLFVAAIHRQVLREEQFLRGHYGEEYTRYCEKVRRYF